MEHIADNDKHDEISLEGKNHFGGEVAYFQVWVDGTLCMSANYNGFASLPIEQAIRLRDFLLVNYPKE